jgi:hypothetical protein
VNDVKLLKETVEKLHNCKARHRNSVRVQEKFKGEIVWDGFVEVFELEGAKPSARCYAWQHSEDDTNTRTRVVTVLENPPVNSPQTAVKAAIVGDFKRTQSN